MVTAKPVSNPAKDLADAFSQLDSMASETPDATPPPPPREPPAPPELPDGQQPEAPPASDDDAEPKADDGKKAADDPKAKEPPKPAPKPEKAATLRERKDQLERENAALASKVKELETKTVDPAAHPEFKKLRETNEQIQKRLDEAEEELRFAAYEKHPDYKKQFETPFVDAYAAGQAKVASFKLTDAEGNVRQGTKQDFDALMRITDDDAAAEKAAEMFGNKAPMVLFHREQVQQLNAARVKALEHYRTEGTAREAARAEAAKKAGETFSNMFVQEMKAGVEKYGQWFKPVEGDPKSAEILDRGFHFADVAFGMVEKDANGKVVQRSPEDKAKLGAAIRNKAGAFDHAIYLLNKQKALVKELQTKLKQYESSEPGTGDRNGKNTAHLTLDQQIERDLAKYAR